MAEPYVVTADIYVVIATYSDAGPPKVLGVFQDAIHAHGIQEACRAAGAHMQVDVVQLPLNKVQATEVSRG
jgi:hypothetical protein